MIALLIGVVLIVFAVYTVLPEAISYAVLNWWPFVKVVLLGGIPLFALFCGFIALMIGFADIKDKREAKKEEEEEKRIAAEAKNEAEKK